MILKADRNCFLTQAQDVANIEDRQFKELVYIATAADAAAWRQVTEAEKARLRDALNDLASRIETAASLIK